MSQSNQGDQEPQVPKLHREQDVLVEAIITVDKLGQQKDAAIYFDYQVLSSAQRHSVQEKTGEIRERLRRSAQDIWEIGQRLVEVRTQLNHGQFESWLKSEFGWSRRTAYNFISVYETFRESASFAKIDISTSALYLLASPSTPQAIREEFIERAERGEKITYKVLSQLIKLKKNTKPSTSSKDRAPSHMESILDKPKYSDISDQSPDSEAQTAIIAIDKESSITIRINEILEQIKELDSRIVNKKSESKRLATETLSILDSLEQDIEELCGTNS